MNHQLGPINHLNPLIQSPQVIKKHFSYKQNPIIYINKASIKQTQDKGKGYFKVRNILCRKQNQRLVKITEIAFEDRVITITDELFPGDRRVFKTKQKISTDKIQSKPSAIRLKNQSFMVTESQITKPRIGLLSKMYKNILKMYICWLNCFENLSAEQDIMKNIIKSVNKYTLQLLHAMRNRPIIVDSFKKFVSCNSQNLHNISKQNSRQNYLVGTKRLVKFFQQQNNVETQQIKFPKIEINRKISILGGNSVSLDNSFEGQTIKKEGEQSMSGSDRHKTSYSLS